MTATSFTVKINHFEGPFDLLLFFIEKDELDINDIPISKITDDFLSFLKEMEILNIDLASEFIVVAATLCRIKAKMLLPRKELDEEGNEIDPREELISRLLEYKKYKSILDEMQAMEENRLQKFARGNSANELKSIASKSLVDAEMESVSLFKLLKTFQKVMERFENNQTKPAQEILNFKYDIENQTPIILQILNQNQNKADFNLLFDHCENRIHAIVTFLTILELINLEQIVIQTGIGINNFIIALS
jgi:segregation and condensation protein A